MQFTRPIPKVMKTVNRDRLEETPVGLPACWAGLSGMQLSGVVAHVDWAF